MKTMTKLEIAEHQLRRALILYLDDSDHVSAITLAGAAEEILGKLVVERGEETPEIKRYMQVTHDLY